MGLDYTNGCVNFRDLGEFINLICEQEILQEQQLFRGGSIDYIEKHEEIGQVNSIINLRNSADNQCFEINYYHFPMSNKIEKYDTSQKEVRKWLNNIVKVFENDQLEFPILIHCLSGKDRTGIVIAALLLIMEIDVPVIKQEYLLSDGEVKEECIDLAINGMKDLKQYFNRIDLKRVKKQLNHHLKVKA